MKFILKCRLVEAAGVVARHADHEANKHKLGPPKIPKAQREQHGAHSEHEMNAHVNCFFGEVVVLAEHGFGVVAE